MKITQAQGRLTIQKEEKEMAVAKKREQGILFEIGKTYIVDVTENGIVPVMEAVTLEECLYAENQRQFAEWLKELKQLREQTRWIPVSERLPEDKQKVIFTNKKNEIGLEIYHKEIGFLSDDVIAWMPLPKKYEPEESEVKENEN